MNIFIKYEILYKKSSGVDVSEFQAPNQQITTADWLKTLSDKIVQAVNSNKQQRHLEEKKMTDVKSKLGDKVDKIKLIHSVHSKLLVDVKPFLKTMAKVCCFQ